MNIAKSSERMKNMYKIPEPSEVETKYRNKLRKKCKGKHNNNIIFKDEVDKCVEVARGRVYVCFAGCVKN